MKSFETKMTLRLYDTAFVQELESTYKASGERFESKNHFLTVLLKIGLAEKLKADFSKRFSSANKADDPTLEQIRQLIEDLHINNKQQVQELLAHLQISEKLTAAVYNMLLALSEDERISTAQVEAGFYDELPERLVSDLRELFKQIIVRLPK